MGIGCSSDESTYLKVAPGLDKTSMDPDKSLHATTSKFMDENMDDEMLKNKVQSVTTKIDQNIDSLNEALKSGDKAQVKESVTTIVEEVTYLLEVIEYRIVRLQRIPDDTKRENEYKILYIEIQYAIKRLTVLED